MGIAVEVLWLSVTGTLASFGSCRSACHRCLIRLVFWEFEEQINASGPLLCYSEMLQRCGEALFLLEEAAALGECHRQAEGAFGLPQCLGGW